MHRCLGCPPPPPPRWASRSGAQSRPCRATSPIGHLTGIGLRGLPLACGQCSPWWPKPGHHVNLLQDQGPPHCALHRPRAQAELCWSGHHLLPKVKWLLSTIKPVWPLLPSPLCPSAWQDPSGAQMHVTSCWAHLELRSALAWVPVPLGPLLGPRCCSPQPPWCSEVQRWQLLPREHRP